MPEEKEKKKPSDDEEKEDEEEESPEDSIEIEGALYKKDPENPEEPLKDDEGNPIPYEKKEEKIKEKEPPKRFPKSKEQTPVEKQIGFLTRKLEKIEEKLESGDLGGKKETDLEEEKGVTKRELEKILEKRDRKLETDNLVTRFLAENPDFKKYEKRIRIYAKDPDYANVPIGFIASGIVGEHLDEEANLRADLKRKADKEAEKTKLGGSSKRGIPTKKKIWDMTPEEFREHQTEVLQKGRE